MWNNNKTISRTYCSADQQNAYAIVSGISGWKKIKTGAASGVTNVFMTLNAAKANGRKVNVYIVNNQIERVILL